MNYCYHTSNLRLAQKMWVAYGGAIVPIPGTGEMRYIHPLFPKPLRVNNRRKDVSAKLLTRINQAAKRTKQPVQPPPSRARVHNPLAGP